MAFGNQDLMMTAPERGPTIRLPWPFGTTVYHRAKKDRVPGLVTAYAISEGQTQIRVVWSDDLKDGYHFAFELTTEFEPTFTSD